MGAYPAVVLPKGVAMALGPRLVLVVGQLLGCKQLPALQRALDARQHRLQQRARQHFLTTSLLALACWY